MNKSNINMENVLPGLPDGFDRRVIVMPKQVRRGQANTLRLYKCDFDPIDRSGFKGFFAVPNKRHIGGTKESVAERARTLSERRCEMTEKRLIGECMERGKDGCCCYVYDKEVCGKPCSGQDKDCKHFFRVARWRNAKCAN